MEQLANTINSQIEFPIDFQGQQKADNLIKVLLISAIIFSVLAGFVTDNINSVVVTFGVCLAATFLLVLPPWPTYRKNPVTWLLVKYDL